MTTDKFLSSTIFNRDEFEDRAFNMTENLWSGRDNREKCLKWLYKVTNDHVDLSRKLVYKFDLIPNLTKILEHSRRNQGLEITCRYIFSLK